MPGEIIRFETNISVEIAFTHAQGIASEGRFGTQWYRGTTDGRSVYLPQIVENKLIEMDVQPGELVSICKAEVKRGQRRSIEWQARRVDPPGDPSVKPQPPQQPVPIQARPVTQQPPASRPASGAPPARETAPQAVSTIQPKPNGAAIENHTAPAAPAPAERPIFQQSMTNMLRSCLCVAIDAAKDAHEYAARKGFPLTFGPDQIEAMGISIFIQLSKTQNIQQMNQRYQAGTEARTVNGGTSWPH